jgi:hypothetical protein
MHTAQIEAFTRASGSGSTRSGGGQLQDEGEDVPEAALACVSPYLTEHINRFGDYVLNMNRKPPRPAYEFSFRTRSAATG